MKRKLVLLFLTLIIELLCGCAAFVATPVMGGLYTGVTAPITYDPGNTGLSYQILGLVEGKSSASSILGIVATGDASVYAAYQNALRQVDGAEQLIEVTVDYQVTSVLGLFASYTTIVRGKAIKRIR